MKTMLKIAAVATMAGALAAGIGTPAQARHGGRNAAVAANAADNGSYYGPAYAYEPAPYAYGYAEPAYNAYDYAPDYYGYGYPQDSCAIEGSYGKTPDTSFCGG